MPISVDFPYTCSCSEVSGTTRINEPITINGMYVAPDCKTCGNTIIIIPKEKISDYEYEYTLRICKTEREDNIKIPPK